MNWNVLSSAINVFLYSLLAIGMILGIFVLIRSSMKIRRFGLLNERYILWYNYSPILTALYGIFLMAFFACFNIAMQLTNIASRAILYLLALVSLGGTLWFMKRAYKYRKFSKNIQEQISFLARREKTDLPKS